VLRGVESLLKQWALVKQVIKNARESQGLVSKIWFTVPSVLAAGGPGHYDSTPAASNAISGTPSRRLGARSGGHCRDHPGEELFSGAEAGFDSELNYEPIHTKVPFRTAVEERMGGEGYRDVRLKPT
jgi:hypothetical protein